MSISLQKGQKVDLTKGNAGLNRIVVGLGWDQAGKAGGLFGGSQIDCDASVILLDADGKLKNKKDVIYFRNRSHSSGAVKHMGDNLTGAGEGDDEQIVIELQKVPSGYERIVFVVNIYQAQKRRQHFGMIKNAFIRLVDAANNSELCRYNLSENYDDMTAMIFGEVYRRQGEWKFNAIGAATMDNSIEEMANKYL